MRKESDTQRLAEQSFYLNDQVSTFQITVNVFTSEGKYGFIKKTLSANKLVYSQFNVPKTIVADDIINIPIKIQNNLNADTELTAFIYDNRDGKEYKSSENSLKMAANAFTSINYKLLTRTDDLFKNITLRCVLVGKNGKIYDSLEQNSTIILNGFPETKSFSNILGMSAGGI